MRNVGGRMMNAGASRYSARCGGVRSKKLKDPNDFTSVAETVRAACVDAAIQAYEDAGVRGLCDDGRWEYAIAAIRRLDLQSLRGLGEWAGDPEAHSQDP
jgi:hypothetical protein